ncbi:MAG: hypothetical protein AMJ69_08835 [Gammaproteobacteria bacterium SG8_47]|nr:MAG: hypothetical protein AMJ69_08835 [Gammaproteobacteria bacterium SG8_47]
MNKLLREPLLHFVLLGAAIFGFNALVTKPAADAQPRVEVTAADIEHLRTLWQRTWQRPPSAQELRGVVEAQVREEILYREALAMGLGQDDTVVRRRLAQKLEFLAEDLLSTREPSTEELERYFIQHTERYRVPARLSFTQVYFSTDRHGVETEAVAREALLALTAGSGSPAEAGQGMGDALFTLDYAYTDLSMPDVAHTFGREFADAIESLPTQQWQGPVASGYGLHLVFIQERIAGELPALVDVRDAVLRDYEQARRDEAAQAFYDRLKQGYRIVIDENALSAAGNTVPGTETAQ